MNNTLSCADVELLDYTLAQRQNMSFPGVSSFRVIAGVRTSLGSLKWGTNLEYASENDLNVLCAERVAIARANIEGERKITDIAIIGEHKEFGVGKQPVMPCGACRQVLNEVAEISGKPIRIIASNGDGTVVSVTDTSKLLPVSFGPASLGVSLEKYGHSCGCTAASFPSDKSLGLMKDLAKRAASASYRPYFSGYSPAGVAICYLKDGSRETKISLGAEFQNASYGLTMSAFVVALSMARIECKGAGFSIEKVVFDTQA